MIEAEVHSSLRAFMREQNQPSWPHHLTMARLVARALRLGRPALIQTGSSLERYAISYLIPALMGEWPVILVAPTPVQQYLLETELPRLQQWLETKKAVKVGDRWPHETFQGLLLTSPESWLSDRIHHQQRFPSHVMTIIDQADYLEEWGRQQLTTHLYPNDWDVLIEYCPQFRDFIRDIRVKLTKAIFQHPPNPYSCCLVETVEQEILKQLFDTIEVSSLSNAFRQFWHCWQTDGQLMWASIAREKGLFTLHCGPVEVSSILSPIWEQQPFVLVGGFLDWKSSATIYRKQLGLGELTCLKFTPDRQQEFIKLYIPDSFPLPNTPEFQPALLKQVSTLIHLVNRIHQPIVLLVEDIPLKPQIGATLAAEFGSRVQVEKISGKNENTILISSWGFWRSHQYLFPTPQLLILATLPIPSLENPVVAGKVTHYKQSGRDWFRLYLLPTALRELQRAIAPIRQSQGIVALFDSRVNNRSYGKQILTAIEPFARTNYLDNSWVDSNYLS
ncbi:MAG: helicase C-terminal domain-containing protein [Chroococcales cyanobacterium]